MKRIKRFNEEFDPMIGIENFLNSPIWIAIATAWFMQGKFKYSNIEKNISSMKNDFLNYANGLGYTIDPKIVDLKFNELINKIKKILKNE